MTGEGTNVIGRFEPVRYVGPARPDLGLTPGETGWVLDLYGDGNVEVEFAFPDGTTWLQCALPVAELRPADADPLAPPPLSRTTLWPALKAFEEGGNPVRHPESGELVEVARDATRGETTLSTASLGELIRVSRPQGGSG